jgi:hypothetical protein
MRSRHRHTSIDRLSSNLAISFQLSLVHLVSTLHEAPETSLEKSKLFAPTSVFFRRSFGPSALHVAFIYSCRGAASRIDFDSKPSIFERTFPKSLALNIGGSA